MAVVNSVPMEVVNSITQVTTGLMFVQQPSNLQLLPAPKSWCGRLVKVGLCGLALWGAWKCVSALAKWKHQKEINSRSDYIRLTGLEVFQFLRDEANNEVPDHFYEEPVLPEGLSTGDDLGPRMRRRHKSTPFLAGITKMAKNHFGGCPEPTRANSMAVTKLVYELCKEHGCLPHQTKHILAIVVPLVLTPDQFDISSRALLNSDELCEARAHFRHFGGMKSWMEQLINGVSSNAVWRRCMDKLCGMPDWAAFKIVS
nr:subunit of replicase complex [Tolivirales sp.]